MALSTLATCGAAVWVSRSAIGTRSPRPSFRSAEAENTSEAGKNIESSIVLQITTWQEARVLDGRCAPCHFKNCKQCDIRFLARRADQDFHSAKCALRWRRSHPDDRRNCAASRGAIENIGDNRAVFAVPPVMAVSGIEQVCAQNP